MEEEQGLYQRAAPHKMYSSSNLICAVFYLHISAVTSYSYSPDPARGANSASPELLTGFCGKERKGKKVKVAHTRLLSVGFGS